jgi:hypothetical protein
MILCRQMIELAVTGWVLAWGEPNGRTYYTEPLPSAKHCFEAAKTLPLGYQKKGCFYVKDGEKQGRKF